MKKEKYTIPKELHDRKVQRMNLKMDREDAGSIESNKYYLYSFTIVPDQLNRKKDFQFNVKLEEGKIIFEISIDKDTQNVIFKEFMELMGMGKGIK